MTAPVRDGSAIPTRGAPFTNPFAFDLEVPIMAPASPFPRQREAEVVPMNPATVNADTEEIELPELPEHQEHEEHKEHKEQPQPAAANTTRPPGAVTVQQPTAAPPPPPPPSPVPAEPEPVNLPPVAEPPQLVAVEPETLGPTAPTQPDAKKFKWERALSFGYWMSVGVGMAGQIFAFGALIAEALPGELKWLAYIASAVSASFAEVTMIGTGTAALHRRYAGGSWKLLAVISWIACAYAVALNAIHWAPISVGLAIPFAGGSALGFTAHAIAEHLAARDFERAQALYRAEIAEIEAERKRREAEIHEAWMKREREQAEAAEAERKRREALAEEERQAADAHRRQQAQAERFAAEHEQLLELANKTLAGRKKTVNKPEAVAIAVANRLTTKATLRDFLVARNLKYSVSEETLKDWAKDAKQRLEAAAA